MRLFIALSLVCVLYSCDVKPGDDLFGGGNQKRQSSDWFGEPITTKKTKRTSIKKERNNESQELTNAEKLLNHSVNIDVYFNGNPLSLGSGCFIKPNIVVTNFHVIEGGNEFKVTINSSGKTLNARLLKFDPIHDIALLKIANYKSAHFLKLNTKFPRIGIDVLAAGSPEGESGSISDGIVSAIRKSDPYDFDLIQFTASISHGSSGGPIINDKLELIGITVGSNSNDNAQNLNYAIPAKYIWHLLDDENN